MKKAESVKVYAQSTKPPQNYVQFGKQYLHVTVERFCRRALHEIQIGNAIESSCHRLLRFVEIFAEYGEGILRYKEITPLLELK